jgi:ribosomal protein L37E
MNERCPRCAAKGYQSGDTPCASCGWQDPILPPWVPSGWYQDPANPDNARWWTCQDRWIGRAWRGKGPKKPIPTEPPPGWVEPPPPTEIHEDGTKTCPRCAETVQGAALVCRFCGYSFDGTSRAVAPGEANTSGAAVAAFICSLVGLWIAGIPLGIHALRQIDSSGGRKTGRGFATAGVILGVLGLVGTVVLIVLIVAAANHTSGCIYNAGGECVPG